VNPIQSCKPSISSCTFPPVRKYRIDMEGTGFSEIIAAGFNRCSALGLQQTIHPSQAIRLTSLILSYPLSSLTSLGRNVPPLPPSPPVVQYPRSSTMQQATGTMVSPVKQVYSGSTSFHSAAGSLSSDAIAARPRISFTRKCTYVTVSMACLFTTSNCCPKQPTHRHLRSPAFSALSSLPRSSSSSPCR